MRREILLALMVMGVGCGIADPQSDPQPAGPVCYSDNDCVPDDCCGEATRAVHVSAAPDCRGVRCTGSCPTDRAECGCAIPHCADSHCTLAYGLCG
jgi:hypothetical protein